jgi:hypothetical protein
MLYVTLDRRVTSQESQISGKFATVFGADRRFIRVTHRSTRVGWLADAEVIQIFLTQQH